MLYIYIDYKPCNFTCKPFDRSSLYIHATPWYTHAMRLLWLCYHYEWITTNAWKPMRWCGSLIHPWHDTLIHDWMDQADRYKALDVWWCLHALMVSHRVKWGGGGCLGRGKNTRTAHTRDTHNTHRGRALKSIFTFVTNSGWQMNIDSVD